MYSLLVFTTFFLLATPTWAAPKPPKLQPGQGFLEGFVLNKGEPIRGVQVLVSGPPRQVNNDFVLPIVTSQVIGIIAVTPPSSTSPIWGVATTDKNGHYLIVLPRGYFRAAAYAPKKQTALKNLVKTVFIEKGEGLRQDYDLGAKWKAAEDNREDFGYLFKQVIASATDEEFPLRPLMLILDSHVMPRFTLPGADVCGIVVMPTALTNGKILSSYTCFADYENHQDAEVGYESLIKLVTETTGWKAVADPASKDRRAKFEGAGIVIGDEFFVSLSKSTVNLNYTTFGRRDVK